MVVYVEVCTGSLEKGVRNFGNGLQIYKEKSLWRYVFKCIVYRPSVCDCFKKDIPNSILNNVMNEVWYKGAIGNKTFHNDIQQFKTI